MVKYKSTLKYTLLSTPRLCSNWFLRGSTAISHRQCSLTFMRERYLHRCSEQSFAIRAYAMSDVGRDVVSVHKLFAYGVVTTRLTFTIVKYCVQFNARDRVTDCFNFFQGI